MKDSMLSEIEAYWRKSSEKEEIKLIENNMSEEDYQKAKRILCSMIDMILADESSKKNLSHFETFKCDKF